VIKDNFELIGTSALTPDQPISFEDNTAHEYPLLCIKRQNLVYAKILFVMQKRQDLFSMFFTAIFGSCMTIQKDTVWIEIPIKRKTAVKSEILLIKKAELNEAKKSMPHLEKLLKPVIPNTFEKWDDDNNILCLAEN